MTCFFRNIIFILLFPILVSNLFSQEILRLATTTSTYDTGLLDFIVPPFENKYNAKVHIIAVGTGKAIKLGENGDVDVILVHAKKAEEKFVSDGFGVNRRDVMYNDFIIVGPREDPAGIKGLKNPAEALTNIYRTKQIFLSRGDESGTHKKEKMLWSKTDLQPEDRKNSWYMISGQGQMATLRIADEKNGYVLIDRGTYLFNKKSIRLKIMVSGGKELLNPYSIITVSPYKHEHIKYELAMSLIAWLTSPKCQDMIANYKINGEILFHKNAAQF